MTTPRVEGIQQLRFTFDRPLEDPSLVFLEWKDGVQRASTPPPVGTSWVFSPPPML